MDNPQLRSFRLACKPGEAALVEDLLQAQGIEFVPEPFHPLARRLVASPLPLGSSIAAAFGLIYIQDRSSMLPPLALAPESGASVLDMCASPGGKTGFLGQMAGPEGFVLGNEPSRDRLVTLRRNLRAMNLFCCATCSYPGERLPLDDGFERILLDPPCSGWGTAEKNPRVLRLWQGEKIKPLISLQRALLSRAFAILRPGGRLVYSTCTTNAAENEEQLRFACDELGFEFVPLAAPPGFRLSDPADPRFEGCWRVPGKSAPAGVSQEAWPESSGQGFFVGLLQKPALTGTESKSRAVHETEAPERPAATPGLEPGNSEQGPETGNSEQRPAGGAALNAFFTPAMRRDSRFVGERRRHSQRALPGRPLRPGGDGQAGRGLFPDDCSGALALAEALPDGASFGPFVDPAAFANGVLAVYNGVVHYLPRAGLRLPPGFAWKGFALGRSGSRLSPWLRGLMPPAQKKAGAQLQVEDADTLLALLGGQSLPVDVNRPELGLYYKDLPLCRLSVKGRRAVLPPR